MLFTLTIILMVAVLIVLFTGVILMAGGGEKNRRYANKLMQWRIYLQAAAVLLAMLAFASA